MINDYWGINERKLNFAKNPFFKQQNHREKKRENCKIFDLQPRFAVKTKNFKIRLGVCGEMMISSGFIRKFPVNRPGSLHN